MIYYDPHKWRSLIKIHGSVLPKSLMWAIPSATIAFLVKTAEGHNFIDLTRLSVLSQTDIYSGFTFVLGFSLVFRTSQSYYRYWTAATSVHEMGSEWIDACSSLISFAQVSLRPAEEIERFAHHTVRLFCLLHAMAMEEIATLEDKQFPLLDIEALQKQDLKIMAEDSAQGRKMQVVLAWIKVHIIKSIDSGILKTPPPILTRVYQQLGSGLVKCYNAQQVVIWPFPFPYSQMNLVLVYIYMLVTPLVVATHDAPAYFCAFFTLVSVLCMLGLDLIASELENPFGDDPNDLPVETIHMEVTRTLLLLLDPRTMTTPRFSSKRFRTYAELQKQSEDDLISLQQFHQKIKSAFAFAGGTSPRQPVTPKKKKNPLLAQIHWAEQQFPHSDKIRKWLRLQTFNETDDNSPQPPDPHPFTAFEFFSEASQYFSENKSHLPTPNPDVPVASAREKQTMKAFETCIQAMETRSQQFLTEHMEKQQILNERLVTAIDSIVIKTCQMTTDSVSGKTDKQQEPPWRIPKDASSPENVADADFQQASPNAANWQNSDPPMACCALSTSKRVQIQR